MMAFNVPSTNTMIERIELSTGKTFAQWRSKKIADMYVHCTPNIWSTIFHYIHIQFSKTKI